MASPTNRNREIDEALTKLAEEVGAHVRFEHCRGHHRRAIFTYQGRSRFDTLTGTPSSGGIVHAARRQAKRTLRSLGAPL
jgi:hypothetical protein